jgi:hypothetical protein
MHSLSPNYGPVEGGISLTVTGSDFLSFPQLHVRQNTLVHTSNPDIHAGNPCMPERTGLHHLN